MSSAITATASEKENLAEIPTEPPRARTSFYRPELDVLRFFAFFAVFQFHLVGGIQHYVRNGGYRWLGFANNIARAGTFGVDLFFALSAYLITELLLREKRQFGGLDVKAFYRRRILRIWPLYFFAIGLALLPTFNREHQFTWRYAAAFLLLSGNWSIIAWGWTIGSIANPLWTVSIEEQFYLLWPPIVRRLSRDRIWIAVAAMFLLANATRIVMVAIHGGLNSVWCNTLCRLDPIASGILLAAILNGRIPNFKLGVRLAMLFSGPILLILVANYLKINNPTSLEWVPTLIGFPVVAIGSTLILLAALGLSVRLPATLVYLGKISYGLYVFHRLGILLTDRLIGNPYDLRHVVVRELLSLTITVLLASVSYRFLETPFLRLKKRFELVHSRPV